MSYYINKNEDVLITTNEPPEGFYELCYIDDVMGKIALHSGLFLYCKACALANYKNHSTAAKAILTKIKEYGVELPEYYFTGELTPYLCSMDALWLSCLWGGNRTDIKFVNDVLIPNEYIKEYMNNYSKELVDNFMNGLFESGCIKLK